MGIGKCNGLRAGTVGQVGAHRSEAVSWGEKQSAIAADALRSGATRARAPGDRYKIADTKSQIKNAKRGEKVKTEFKTRYTPIHMYHHPSENRSRRAQQSAIISPRAQTTISSVPSMPPSRYTMYTVEYLSRDPATTWHACCFLRSPFRTVKPCRRPCQSGRAEDTVTPPASGRSGA